jgi:hypothetical protein
MKITLDISKLVENGQITQAEADRLQTLASHDTGSLGINILLGFGVVAVAGGAGALVPTALTAMALGAVIFVGGLVLAFNTGKQWEVLAQICLTLGALTFCGGVIGYGEGSLASMLIVAVAMALAAIAARASLLAALAVLAAAACLGARTGYSHATYSLAIFEPTLTVMLFSALALVLYLISKRLPADYERISLTGARAAVLLVNCAFWIGSLWGDPLAMLRSGQADPLALLMQAPVIKPVVFSIVWALALIGAGVWAVHVNRRWLVNLVAVFAGIHFYTQWFERLGATPLSVLLGGLVMLASAIALWLFNRSATAA